MNIRNTTLALLCGLLLAACAKDAPEPNYMANRAPLEPSAFLELPLGAIHPDGWLQEQLVRMKDGLTGQMDSVYEAVDGPDNAWLGGEGDTWERGPYWIDGLVPLAYILDDEGLKAKARPWIEWTLASQDEEGYFGPREDRPHVHGLQRSNSRDWWPKMVMLKVLKQYYMATGDERVIPFMTRYFRYQLAHLPQEPLDNWTFWGAQRGGDNLGIVYWLYNITGEKFLLELGELIHSQTFDWTGAFLERESIRNHMEHHCVNLAQGFKEPVVYWQQSGDARYLEACKHAAQTIRHSVGQPTGLWGGDEMVHTGRPTAGSELCTAVEMMYSLEEMMRITGDVQWMDYLERVAYNALPTQVGDDFMTKQYYQQTNQIACDFQWRDFTTPHDGSDTVFGQLSGYPCCLSNMHQGWPKFVQNLWYATPEGGAAALVYAPSHVEMLVADKVPVKIKEETFYPFRETVVFSFELPAEEGLEFPFTLRIPQWCEGASISVNGEPYDGELLAGSLVTLRRRWSSGDVLLLTLPQNVQVTRWWEGSAVVERGALVYALKMDETWTRKEFPESAARNYGPWYWEVSSDSPWNYALHGWMFMKPESIAEQFKVVENERGENYPWNVQNAPVSIFAQARRIPAWHEYNGNCGPIQYEIQGRQECGDEETIELIPYGCTTLRITEFPLR